MDFRNSSLMPRTSGPLFSEEVGSPFANNNGLNETGTTNTTSAARQLFTTNVDDIRDMRRSFFGRRVTPLPPSTDLSSSPLVPRRLPLAVAPIPQLTDSDRSADSNNTSEKREAPEDFFLPPAKRCPSAPIKISAELAQLKALIQTNPACPLDEDWKRAYRTAYFAGTNTLQYYNGREFTRGESVGKGCFMQVSKIEADEPVVHGVDNSQLVFKSILPERLDRRYKSIEGLISGTVRSYQKTVQFVADKALPLLVAKLYNEDTAKSDCFLIVEKIECPFPITWSETTTLAQIDEDTMRYLDVIKAVFAAAYKANMYIDLSASNVHINAEGKVVLIDYTDDNDEDDEFRIIVPKLVESFAQGNKSVRDHLDPRMAT